MMVLTVATPVLKTNGFTVDQSSVGSYLGAAIIVANRKMYVNGNSNQIFLHRDDNGFLMAFATDMVNQGKFIIDC